MKTVVLTGTTSGIGRAIDTILTDAGWKVVGLPRKIVDLSNLEEVSKIAESLVGEYEHIDAFIHVAGVWHDKAAVHANKDLEDYTSEQIVEAVNVGLTSFMVLAARCLPNMPKDGTIIGISGTFADGASGWVPYFTSKRALEDFLTGLAQDYPAGPKVYGISPADTATAAYTKFYPQHVATAQSPQIVAKLVAALLAGETPYHNGDIIALRAGKATHEFHA